MNLHKKSTLLALPLLLGLTTGTAQAGLINPGFETGDLTGWSTNLSGGLAQVVTSHTGNFSTYSPMEGSYFLSIVAGFGNVWQTVTQSVSLNAGDTLSGWAAFDWQDYYEFVDDARVRILDSMNTELAIPYYKGGTLYEDYADYPWTAWSWTAPTAGTFVIEYGSRNIIDEIGPSYALFDAKANGIPEPGSLALLGLGMVGLAFVRRRRNAAC